MNKKATKFSPEVRKRAVRLVREQRSEHCGRTLHGQAADEAAGLARRNSRQASSHDESRYERAAPAGPGQPAVQG